MSGENIIEPSNSDLFDSPESVQNYVKSLEKQLSEKEAELHRFKVKWDKFSMGVAEKKIESLEAEIERLKMLTNFPESSFKWRWAKAQEEIAELRETLNDYETVVADMYESKIASLSQKLEKYEASMKSCANPEAHWEFLSPKKSEEA